MRPYLLSSTALYGAVGISLMHATAANAGDMAVSRAAVMPAPQAFSAQAVDGLNGKVEALGGSMAGRSLFGAQGSLSIPLQGLYGAQIDGAAGSFDHRGFGHVGGHLFWRDPAQGLIGAYASYTRWDQFGGVHVTNFAAEGERYFGRWTLQGIAGIEFGNSVSSTVTTTATTPPAGIIAGVITTNTFTEGYDVRTRFFDQINLKYYLTDDWDGYIGHRYLGGKNALALGTEYALPLGHGIMGSAFVEARVGEGDFHGVWGGLRFYFGQKDKPLIARHREDDPVNWGVSNLLSIINNYNETTGSSSSLSCDPGYTLQPDGTCGGEPT
jgi:hypothetical protein